MPAKLSVARIEIRTIAQPNRLQFKLSSFLIAVALAATAIQGSYVWHHWILWSSTPFGDPAAEWFISGRQWLFSWSTPFIAAFVLVALVSAWFGIVNRHDTESVIGAICLSYPLLIFLGPLAFLSFLFPVTSPVAGIWLLWRRRYLLGSLVVILAVVWLVFAYYYVGGLFEVYGD